MQGVRHDAEGKRRSPVLWRIRYWLGVLFSTERTHLWTAPLAANGGVVPFCFVHIITIFAGLLACARAPQIRFSDR